MAADARLTADGVDGPNAGRASQVRARTVLVVLFVGFSLYVAFGKGFAYAGVPPFFVGEALLVVVLLSASGPGAAVARGPAQTLTAGLVGIGLVQFAIDRINGAVPFQETVRGLAPVYYAGFAFGTYALLRDFERRNGRRAVGEVIERGAERAAPVVTFALVVLAAVVIVEPTNLPVWPASGVPLLLTKSGDIAVALVLVLPVIDAIRRSDRRPVLGGVLIATWATTVLFIGVRSRGGLLALVVGLIVMRPNVVRLVKGILAVTALILVLYVTGLSVDVRGRELSYTAMGDAVESVLRTAPEAEIASNYLNTTNWRADWWSSIWTDVVDERMVLHGRGWGDNLALRHGVTPALAADDPRVLRLPHNIFFSLVGRAGLLTGVVYLAVPIVTLVRSRSPAASDLPDPLVLAARGGLAAALTTAMTDTYLESPQGGIVYWCLVGFLWWAAAPTVGPDGGTPSAVRS